MEVHLPPVQEAFIREAVATGRRHRPAPSGRGCRAGSDAGIGRERRQQEILARVDCAEASLARRRPEDQVAQRRDTTCRRHKTARYGAFFWKQDFVNWGVRLSLSAEAGAGHEHANLVARKIK